MGFALSNLQLSSTAFGAGSRIPTRYTGEGLDASPPLAWQNVPANTKSFALVCHDPDAPLVKTSQYGFVHWVLYGIPSDVRILGERTNLHVRGRSDFGSLGYGGPMPPEGHGVHNYFFWLFALSKNIKLREGLGMTELFRKIETHVIAMNRLVGTYSRN